MASTPAMKWIRGEKNGIGGSWAPLTTDPDSLIRPRFVHPTFQEADLSGLSPGRSAEKAADGSSTPSASKALSLFDSISCGQRGCAYASAMYHLSLSFREAVTCPPKTSPAKM